jgi:hypothetical protein
MAKTRKRHGGSALEASRPKASRSNYVTIPEQKLLTETAHVNRTHTSHNFTRSYIPEINYTSTEKDLYDGIVFLVGHSQFKGGLCHLPTKRGMKQHTLLVANINNSCFWFTKPKDVDGFIRSRFIRALSYQPRDIADFIHTAKDRFDTAIFTEKTKSDPSYTSFFKSRVKHSTNPHEYCQREWEFVSQDGRKKPEGRVMLLRRDKQGNPYFTVLFEEKIDQGGFTLTKRQLFDKLCRTPYNLRNVLLVDFACTNLHRVSAFNRRRLTNGRI